MMMSEAEDQDIVNEQIANKDNRILDYQFFVPGGGRSPVVDAGARPRRGAGIPSALLRTRVHVRNERPPDLALRDGLRRHGHREPVPEQYRHVPEGEGPGRDGRLRARLRRRKRPAGRRSRRRERLHGRRGPRDDRRSRVVRSRTGRLLPLVRHAEQRAPGNGHRGRGFDQQPSSQQARRFGQNLCLYRRARALPWRRGSRVFGTAMPSSPPVLSSSSP